MEGFWWVDKHDGPVQPALLEVEGLLHDVVEVRLLPPVAPAPALLHRGLKLLVHLELKPVAARILLHVKSSLVRRLARLCTDFETLTIGTMEGSGH